MQTSQEQITAWLLEQSKPLHDAYVMALRLLTDDSIPGRAQLVCHIGRDICTGLPEVSGTAKRPRANTTSIFEEIGPEWAKEKFDSIGTAESADPNALPQATQSNNVSISYHLFNLLRRLMDEHRLGSIGMEEQAIEMFAANDPEAIKHPELLKPMSREWVKLRKWFHHYAHFGVHQKTPAERELQAKFSQLEEYILTVSQSFYEGMEGLDEILGKANS